MTAHHLLLCLQNPLCQLVALGHCSRPKNGRRLSRGMANERMKSRSMMKKAAAFGCSLAALAAGACAQMPRLSFQQSGILPPAGSSFALADSVDAPGSQVISDCLGGAGLKVSDDPGYLAQVTAADRPKAVGALERLAVGDKGKPNWLPGTSPKRSQVRSLALTLVRRASGEEVYRLVVSERYRPKAKAANLAEAVCLRLSPKD